MLPLTKLQRVLAAREASAVERSHTFRHHGSYTDGQHSFDMLTLTLELREDTSAALMKAIIYHDLPERWLGDMPHPAKQIMPKSALHMSVAENHIRNVLGWKETCMLTQEELEWVHIIDRVEFLLWADDQIQMGNRHLEDVLERCHRWFEDNSSGLPTSIAEFLHVYKWQRTPDVFPV